MNCYVHQERTEVVGTCVGCGRFICVECRTVISEKNYCSKCLEEMVLSKDRKIEKLEDKKESPMVFMNAGGASSSSASSASSSFGRSGGPLYPRNSIFVHLVLFFFTAGLGNILYFLYIRSKQKQWESTYR